MNIRLLAIALTGIVCCASGCASARVVRVDSNSVVVAVPDQTNDWPFHYRDEALKVAKENIKDPILVSSVRVKVGESITSNQNSNTHDLGGKDKPKFGEITSTSSVTSIRDEFEYHLEFRSHTPIANSSSNQSAAGQPSGANNNVQQIGWNQPPAASVGSPRKETADPRIPPVVGSQSNTTPGGFPSIGLQR